MKKRPLITLATSLFCLTTLSGFAGETIPYGIVNSASCVNESKYGKDEQQSLEKLRDQWIAMMTDKEKALQEIVNKFNDPEFVDSLSPEAEAEMKADFQAKNEELGRYQNQYMQIMQQAQMKLGQNMHGHISKASEAIAKQKKLPMVVREEACFFYNPSFDITNAIVAEMDKSYDKDHSQAPAPVDQEKK